VCVTSLLTLLSSVLSQSCRVGELNIVKSFLSEPENSRLPSLPRAPSAPLHTWPGNHL